MRYLKLFFILNFLFISTNLFASAATTQRVSQFSNDKVNVWQTTIFPGNQQQLKMHRHEYNRVLVSFDAGTLKIVNDKGKVHFLKLEKNKSYYLTKDPKDEQHTDENITPHPIKVLVIELKN